MGHYKSNVRDLEFNLFEVLGIDKVLATGAFGDLDADTVKEMLTEAAGWPKARWPNPSPTRTATRRCSTRTPTPSPSPSPSRSPTGAGSDGEWAKVGLDEELGGLPGAPPLRLGPRRDAARRQPGDLHVRRGRRSSRRSFYNNGTDEQKKWAAWIAERNWGATMVLTEPDAGSDVGAGRTKAIKQDDGTWHIEGVKRFITSGDSDDMFENIIHLVLARPEGAGPGTKGLSLFFVPKTHFDFETDEPGERNGVFVTNVEHKMGLKASTTCELTFGDHGMPAKGWLVGEVHNGIAQMFDVIENARMMVGTKAIATLSTGYLNALEYAKTRVQGADLTQMTDKAAPRVTITHHPDVRRSADDPEGLRRGPARDVPLHRRASGRGVAEAGLAAPTRTLAVRVNDLLLPIVKGVGSERAYQYLTESLQTFGGSGFLQDYPIEQYIRDAKIDSLYEGTTAIQAQDFFFRKIARDRGVALAHVAGQIQKFLEAEAGNGRLKAERALLATALEDVQAMAATLTGYLMGAQEQPPSCTRSAWVRCAS